MGTSNVNLRSILYENKPNDSNFINWYRDLRIVSSFKKVVYVLDKSILLYIAYSKHIKDNKWETFIMLVSTSLKLQKQYEHMDAHSIIFHMKEMFKEHNLIRCKTVEGTSVVQHGLKMNGYIERLGTLGFLMDHEISVDLILQSSLDSYTQ
ncbi:hypothetical protein MANES_15G181190v8 [Manihot esculenta]|uniref:Uncharacterized protein n=1 Tax=Manihot esculenta TaxID=3983 RepID=A0ACB7GE73_MANES|nr:hypothetical protein MANES_15G181190v8 [Manihot esculenta]